MACNQIPGLASEQIDDIPDRVRKMYERWDNHLVFPLSNSCESYRSGHLQFYLQVKPLSVAFVLHVQADVNRPHCGEEILWQLDTHVESSHHQDNGAVLINAVQRVKHGKWVFDRIPSVVGLHALNDIPGSGGRDSLYLSSMTGEFVFRSWPDSEDRKGNRPLIGLPVAFAGKHPCDMVERGSEMMGNLSGEHAKSWRDAAPRVELNPLIERLVLVFTESACGAFFQERSDFRVEVADVFIGPF